MGAIAGVRITGHREDRIVDDIGDVSTVFILYVLLCRSAVNESGIEIMLLDFIPYRHAFLGLEPGTFRRFRSPIAQYIYSRVRI